MYAASLVLKQNYLFMTSINATSEEQACSSPNHFHSLNFYLKLRRLDVSQSLNCLLDSQISQLFDDAVLRGGFFISSQGDYLGATFGLPLPPNKLGRQTHCSVSGCRTAVRTEETCLWVYWCHINYIGSKLKKKKNVIKILLFYLARYIHL